MNKFKKVAVAAVSAVMAGTMAVSFTACGGGGGGGGSTGIKNANELLKYMQEKGISSRLTVTAGGWKTAKGYWDYLKPTDNTTVDYGADNYHIRNADGTINYSSYTRDSEVTLNLAIGHNNKQLSTSFQDFGGTVYLPDGKSYKDGALKPAWAQMSKELNIKFNDVYKGWATNKNLINIIGQQAGASYAGTDLFTTDLSVAVEQAAGGTSILNLADYLDYMPHFKAFLESNPVVYLSLLQDGMVTSGEDAGDGKVIYIAPYFDGNDDIERYCLMRHDWVEKLLNGNSALKNSATYKDSCKNTVAAESFMGKTGSYSIESTNAEGTGKITIKKDYDKALAAAKDESTALGEAYKAIAGAAYNGTSGNIVDIMNAALAANMEATGAQLADLYRAYIDVCYTKDGAAYFTASTRANLFNGYDACWDVDDLVALLRVAKTNSVALTGSANIPLQGIVPRDGTNDRTPDMVRLACQLYGARGADSRNEYTYIDNAGELQDARNDEGFYVALERFNTLAQEGLIGDYSSASKTGFNYEMGFDANATSNKGQAMMMYDYSQTQTKNGFYADPLVTGVDLPDGYNFAAVVTPVSKWDVNADGSIAANEYFRFTESWRSTKPSGLALNGALKENEAKLKAALQLVDYLYSEDGQIVSTFGPMASDENGTGGFWYNEVAGANDTDTFTYKGVKYKGTEYKGRYTPTITTALDKSFKGIKDGDHSIMDHDVAKKGKLNFTNYARYLIGSTLPVGVKDQSFENQLTSQLGKDGANVVGTCLANGTIKGMTLKIDSNNYWYTVVPTGLPISSDLVNRILNSQTQSHVRRITGTAAGDSKNFLSVMNWVILNGYTKNYSQQDEIVKFLAD